MGWELQAAIDYASNNTVNAFVVISMHDESGLVLYGTASPTFRPDVPLLNAPSRGGLLFPPGGPVPGFSTRGTGGDNTFLASNRSNPVPPNGVQQFAQDQPIKIDFAVRRVPGQRLIGNVLTLGSSIQVEIDLLSAAGARVRGILLNAVEEGVLLRAKGPSFQTPASNASYTVTLDVVPIIP